VEFGFLVRVGEDMIFENSDRSQGQLDYNGPHRWIFKFLSETSDPLFDRYVRQHGVDAELVLEMFFLIVHGSRVVRKDFRWKERRELRSLFGAKFFHHVDGGEMPAEMSSPISGFQAAP